MPRRPPARPAPPPDLGPVWEADLAPVPISFDDDPTARPALLLIVVDGYILSFELVSRPSAVTGGSRGAARPRDPKGIATVGQAPINVMVRHITLVAPLNALLRVEGCEVDVARALPGVDEALRSFGERFTGRVDDGGETPRPPSGVAPDVGRLGTVRRADRPAFAAAAALSSGTVEEHCQ